jgi:hypothetical protein
MVGRWGTDKPIWPRSTSALSPPISTPTTSIFHIVMGAMTDDPSLVRRLGDIARHAQAGASHYLQRVEGLVRKPLYEYFPFCSVEGIEWANQEMPATSVRCHCFLLAVTA